MSTSRPAPPKPAPRAPAAAAHPPAPMQQQSSGGGGGMLSGIGSTIVQGMAFGTGSAIAHRAVGAVADSFSGSGNSSNENVPEYVAPAAAPAAQNDVCAMDKNMFYDCLQQNKSDQTVCNFYYDQLKSCQQNQLQFS